MGWFKRLCLFVFGVAGILALAALALTWVGPWTTQTRSLLEVPWYFMTLEILVCVAALGLLACVLIALFSPRNPRETVVSQVQGGKITVTRAAIVSQAKHTIEADGSFIATSVRVRMRKRGHVRVGARVTPRRPVDVIERGERLHTDLSEGLARVCGDCVQSVDVVFLEPEQQGPTRTYVETAQDDSQGTGEGTPLGTEGISVPLTSQVTGDGPEPHNRQDSPAGAVDEPASLEDASVLGEMPVAQADSYEEGPVSDEATTAPEPAPAPEAVEEV